MKHEFGTRFAKNVRLLGILAVAAAFGASGAAAVELKAETGSPPASVQASATTEAFAKDLAERTNGSVTLNITYGGARAKLTEMADAVGSGIIDLGVVATVYTPGIFPIWSSLATADFRQTTGGDLVAVNAIAATLLAEFPAMQEEVAKHNIKIVGFMPLDELVLYTKRPVASMADLQGMKVRGPSEGGIRTLNYAGAAGMNVPWAEVATSLQTGLIEGVWTNAGFGVATKTHEIATHATYLDLRALVPTVILAMNLDKYNSLSDSEKAALDETYRAMLVKFGELIAGERAAALETLKSDPKVTFIEFPQAERDAWISKTPVVLEEVGGLLDGKGLPGAAITARVKELYQGYNDKTWDPLAAIAASKL
ncbi:MAG: hypothetical protein BroJett024_39920 [Alphaproteobacteria bacterium]|nr:MAG: hypothetical protein BroJett024_39920 [Alphaproteobacteria bacterium]